MFRTRHPWIAVLCPGRTEEPRQSEDPTRSGGKIDIVASGSDRFRDSMIQVLKEVIGYALSARRADTA
jgi:hypothetical protein